MKRARMSLVAVLLWQCTVPAAEPPNDREHRPPIDARTLLAQTELNVLLRQYEKTLGDYYAAKLELQLLASSILPVEKESRERIIISTETRLKLLEEWQAQMRDRIEQTAAELNKLEKDRVSQEAKAPASAPGKSGSPSEREPRPQF